MMKFEIKEKIMKIDAVKMNAQNNLKSEESKGEVKDQFLSDYYLNQVR